MPDYFLYRIIGEVFYRNWQALCLATHHLTQVNFNHLDKQNPIFLASQWTTAAIYYPLSYATRSIGHWLACVLATRWIVLWLLLHVRKATNKVIHLVYYGGRQGHVGSAWWCSNTWNLKFEICNGNQLFSCHFMTRH